MHIVTNSTTFQTNFYFYTTIHVLLLNYSNTDTDSSRFWACVTLVPSCLRPRSTPGLHRSLSLFRGLIPPDKSLHSYSTIVLSSILRYGLATLAAVFLCTTQYQPVNFIKFFPFRQRPLHFNEESLIFWSPFLSDVPSRHCTKLV